MHKRPILSIKSSSAQKAKRARTAQQPHSPGNASTTSRQTGGGEEKRRPEQTAFPSPGGDSYLLEGRRVPLLDAACNELYTR